MEEVKITGEREAVICFNLHSVPSRRAHYAGRGECRVGTGERRGHARRPLNKARLAPAQNARPRLSPFPSREKGLWCAYAFGSEDPAHQR